MLRFFRVFVGLVALAGLTACGDDNKATVSGSGGSTNIGAGGDSGVYAPMIDPADFSTTIDNQYLPWPPGMVQKWVEDQTSHITITVTDQTKTVMGVDCVVVHDELKDETDTVVEDTMDWYAQDKDGNVWYFGEDTTELDATGKPDTSGSWEAGVDGAYPGITMPADAVVGDPYRQEYYKGEAEDWGQIIEVDVSVSVPAGDYTGCIKTKDWAGLHPTTDVENKIYCPGVGNVRAEVVEGGAGLEELTDITIP